MPPATRQRRQQPQRRHRTITLRDFTGGVNFTDSRISIKDNELRWAENCMPVGAGQLQILNGPGAALATFTQGVSWVYGCTLNGLAVLIVVGSDGSLTQITIPGGVQAVIGAAGTVTGTAGTCSFAVWRGTTLLILDPTTGYRSWDGTTLTLISATLRGNALAVFQGRAWLINARTIQVTAPNTFNDVNPANGATSTILSDESFPGDVVAAVSAFEQLWLVGAGAIDAISNVQSTGTSPNVLTTFSITNIVTNLGTSAQHTVLGYFRALTFLAPFGGYAISGVTPQKITEKLDNLFPDLTIEHATCSSAVAIVENLSCLLFRVLYNGNLAQAGAGPIPLILIFANGRWAFASQGDVQWITTLLVAGVPQCWGTDGSTVYQLFGAARTTAVTWKAQGKLSDYGLETRIKHVLKSGLTFQADAAPSITMTIDNESSATEDQSVQTTVNLTIVNNAGDPLSPLLNDSGGVLQLVASGQVLSRQRTTMYGNFVGWTLSGTTAPFLIQTVLLQIIEGKDSWLSPATTAG